MSDRETPVEKSKSKPKWPAPNMYIEEGKDKDLRQINTWF
jgi:hypothetical protein